MRQALYRKYRPKTFEQIYGQDNIVNILKNQIKNNKVSHAYIFSGTRGTGKTSTAKIFAKAVNCLNQIDGSPCNECANCLAIESESTMDIVEMDAASNRGVDDIRQIREQVIYPPTLLKYKVYIIDEAHMITKEGFNALLKMMEEPPKHLIFILATTEIDRIPDTILSRTQRFEFKSIGVDDIKSQIKEILDEENISLDERAVEIISNVASGAMRDALSLLDQVVSIGKSHITSSDVYDLLGVFSDDIKIEYARLIFNKEIKNLLVLIDNELNKGKDANNFIKEIVSFFKDLIYIKIGIKENFVGNLLDNISVEQLINTLDILLEYEQSMKKSDSAGLLFRLASVRLIDYMPRKQLEAKIKNLEERILYLENNKDLMTNNKINKQDISTQTSNSDEKEVKDIDSVKKLLEDYDKSKNKLIFDKDNENLLESEEEASIKKEETSDLELLMKILNEKHKMANLLMREVKESKITLNRIIFYVENNTLPRANALGSLFNDAVNELNQLTGKNYDIRFEIFQGEDENNKYDEEKLNKIRSIFPKDKFNIKERK